MKPTKKEQIELTAKELFLKHGFKKVSVDEICRKANVSRKTFYTFYENKTALVIYLLNHQLDEAMAVYAGIAESEDPFSVKMEKFLTFKLESIKNMSMEFVADFYHPDSGELLTLFNDAVEKSMSFMREFLRKAQERGELNPELNLDYVMWMMEKNIELCDSKELMSFFSNTESMTRQIYQTLVYGIMPINK